MSTLHLTSLRFAHYKAFSSFTLTLRDFNVLVGPNNSGKSTIIGAFRILHEGLRKARTKSPDRVEVDGLIVAGYWIDIDDLPVASENIFHDYDETKPASVKFSLSNGNSLTLYFPERGACALIPESEGRVIRSPKDFRSAFDFEIAFVPILGPVEQREPLFAREAARRALLTSGASRNFRNIWFHYPEDFETFQALVQQSWPGMSIERPELSEDGRQLFMFCPEDRRLREVCWAGYGFQVWCQMLTFIVKGAGASLLVIDEPDIYLHSDLQRQLVALLRGLGPDVLIATHSTEIIAECDPNALLTVNKRSPRASRIRDATQLRQVFTSLGSNLNPTLTQLAKTRRVVVVESASAFQVLAPFARTLGLRSIANRSDFSVIQSDALNEGRATSLVAKIERAVDDHILVAIILDRRYRSEHELEEIRNLLSQQGAIVYCIDRHDVDNYLICATALQRAVERRIHDEFSRTRRGEATYPDISKMLSDISESMRDDVLTRMVSYRFGQHPGFVAGPDTQQAKAQLLEAFEQAWAQPAQRLRLLPGNQLLTALNERLADGFGITISDIQIATGMLREEIAPDAVALLEALAAFAGKEVAAHAPTRRTQGVQAAQGQG